MKTTTGGALLLAALGLAACGGGERGAPAARADAGPRGTLYTVHLTPMAATLEASGTAAPIAEATLATKLMGTVTEVLVHEGDRVRAGQLLLRVDARDLAAKAAQTEAALGEAEAVRAEAATQAGRMRALYGEQAATKAQLDAAETGLARAEAAVATARASGAEVAAVRDYAEVRAPFAGVVTERHVDAGGFAAPGAPLLVIQDASRLRVTASAPPADVRGLRRGDTVAVTLEDVPARAVIEGVVPAPGGSLARVNAIVDNREGRFAAGSAASLSLPRDERPAITVPAAALVRQEDLTGVYVRSASGTELRWVRTGNAAGDAVEVVSGLRDGEQVVVPARPAGVS